MKNRPRLLAKWSLLCCVFEALAAGLPAARAQDSPPTVKATAPVPPAENVPLVVLPFELEDNLVVLSLPMIQSGTGDKYLVPKTTRPFRLILDSGADATLISEEAVSARKIALPPPKPGERPINLNGIGNDKAGSGRLLSDVQYAAGETYISDTPLLAPLTGFFQAGYDGFLGAGVFVACVVEIDYARKTLRLFNPATYTRPAPDSGFVRVPLQQVPNTRTVTAPVDVTPFGFGKTTANLVVDTGGVGTAYFASPFVKRNKWETFAPRTIEIESLGIGGKSNSRRGRLKEVTFGGVTLKAPYADFSFDTKGMMTATTSDGRITGGILSRFTVIFDYARAALYVRPNAGASAPFTYQRFGFALAETPNAAGGWLVDVEPDTPMAKAGIKSGEFIFGIDNKPIAKLQATDITPLLDARTGERVFTIGDAKGEKKRDVRVTPIAL